jgi:hypothetical protein
MEHLRVLIAYNLPIEGAYLISGYLIMNKMMDAYTLPGMILGFFALGMAVYTGRVWELCVGALNACAV